jgi:hypothetical protein
MYRLPVSALAGKFAICRLDPATPAPGWATSAPWASITRTSADLSIVCGEERVPKDVPAVRGWRALEVTGPLDFALTGVLASLLAPLAEAGVSVFAVSTYPTDYVLVREEALERAIGTLEAAGHTVKR